MAIIKSLKAVRVGYGLMAGTAGADNPTCHITVHSDGNIFVLVMARTIEQAVSTLEENKPLLEQRKRDYITKGIYDEK